MGDDYEKLAYDIESSELEILSTNPLHMTDIFLAGVQLMGKDKWCCVANIYFYM